jgi:hypothetical protein
VPGPLDASWLVRLTRTAAYQQARAGLQRSEHGYPLYGEDQEAFQITVRILVRFAEDVRADGASPVVAIFPGKYDLLANQRGITPYNELIAWLHEAGIPTVDLTPRLALETERQGISAMFNDTHYSKLGNALVAAELAERLPQLLAPTCHLPG